MKRHHLAGLAGLLLPLPLLVAGCGAEATPTSSGSSAVDAPAAVPAVSREADGAAMVARLRTALEGITTARIDVSLTGQLEATASGAVDLTGKRPAVRLAPSSPIFGLAEVRLVDGAGYAQVDGEWLRVELDALLRRLPFDPSLLDLDAVTDAVAGGLSDVEVSGDTGEEVWNASVDPEALLAELGDGTTDLDPGYAEVPDSAEVTATFSGDRLDALVVDLGDLGALEVSLTEQGEPVRIAAPRGPVTDFSGFGWSASTPGSVGG